MPMIVPHQSQVGIATANGGQAAQYRSASAFMTPNRTATPEGLQHLARGMDSLGDALFRVGIERQRMQNATDMLADKVAYEDALREFDSNYRQTHQGVSARDAEEAYGQFHKEQHEKLQQKWGGNPFLMEGVNRMAESIRQPSMQRAVAYRDSEEDAYKKSVLESSRAQALQLFADPSRSWQEKEAALQAEENNLRLFAGQQWDGKSGQWTGGTDITADIMAFREKAARADIEGRLAVGDIEGAKLLVTRYGGGTGGRIGDRVAAYESGSQGVKAVGYDRNGGTSYGKYQLSSRQGSYQEWLDYLGRQGPEGKAAAERLRAAGDVNTGGRSGAAVDAYTREAEANPELFERTQREYVEQTHYQPMLAKLPAELRRQVEGNAGLQEMAWSTAVQHGGAGGARIFSRVWKEGMSDGDLVDAVYTARGDNFPSSTPEVRAAVQNRFGRERMLIRGMLRGAALSPENTWRYLNAIRVEENRQRAEAQIDLGSRIEDSIAAWNTGQAAPDAPQKDEILAAFGPEKGAKVWDRLKTAQQFGADLQTVSSLTPAQQDALLQQRKPSPGDGFAVAQKSWESLVQAVKSDREYRGKDPVGYLLQKDSSVRSAFEAWEQSPTPENTRGYVRDLLAAGDIRGMERSESNAPPVLPDAAAARLAAKIMDSASPARFLAQQAAIWGDYWPSVERQLVADNKLPGTLRLVSNMDVESGEILAATARNPKYLEEARASLGMATSDFSAFTQKVFDRMEPLLKSVGAQGDLETEAVLRDGATRLALEYMLRGHSDGDAAEKAAQEISKRYGYGEGRDDGGTYRIPVTRNVDAVRAGAAQELRSIVEKPESLALPGMKGVSRGWLEKTVADTIQREGAWVTAPDESGLLLFVGGYPVRDADGNPVFRSWQEMETTGTPLLMQEDTTLRFLGIESEDLS